MKQFVGFPKIYRLNREIIVTEKLDGTNAQVTICEGTPEDPCIITSWVDGDTGVTLVMYAGSRNRWVTPKADNYGFAQWVTDNAEDLKGLGVGSHFGEWWGRGIQRGYNKKEREFSLFNVSRWGTDRPSCCSVVPIIYQGLFDQAIINGCVERLRKLGSIAAPGFTHAEGIVIFHTQGGFALKVTLLNDESPKGLLNETTL
jgi:hypothetical protein